MSNSSDEKRPYRPLKFHGKTWRDWRSIIEETKAAFPGFYEKNEFAEELFLTNIYLIVWDMAEGDDASRYECVLTAFREAGYAIDWSGTKNAQKFGVPSAVYLKHVGMVIRVDDGKYELVRPSNLGCMSALLFMVGTLGALTAADSALFGHVVAQ